MICRVIVSDTHIELLDEAKQVVGHSSLTPTLIGMIERHKERNGKARRLYVACTTLFPSGVVKIRHRLNKDYKW
jgi:hypothetical protein